MSLSAVESYRSRLLFLRSSFLWQPHVLFSVPLFSSFRHLRRHAPFFQSDLLILIEVISFPFSFPQTSSFPPPSISCSIRPTHFSFAAAHQFKEKSPTLRQMLLATTLARYRLDKRLLTPSETNPETVSTGTFIPVSSAIYSLKNVIDVNLQITTRPTGCISTIWTWRR